MRLDLHVHTYASGDSTTRLEELAARIERDDLIAVTDHHTIAAAREFAALVPGQVIVGEEIDTGAGELIGLGLDARVPPHSGLLETARRVRDQGGLVLAPHPTDPARRGLGRAGLERLANEGLLDLIEVANAKRVAWDHEAALVAREWGIVPIAASDAHVPEALFASCVVVEAPRHELVGPSALLALLRRGEVRHAPRDPVRPWPRPVVPGS